MTDFLDDLVSIEDMKKLIEQAENEGASHIGIDVESHHIIAGKDTPFIVETWILEEE